MGKGLKPDRYLTSLYRVTPEKLIDANVKGLLLDIDNTLVPSHQPDADDRVIHFINEMKLAGIKTAILSNAAQKRVDRFVRPLGLAHVGQAWKPRRSGYVRGLAMLGLPPEQVAMVGDQVFTDIWGGNRNGLFTILVAPMKPKEPFWVKFKRLLESWVIGGMVPDDSL